MDLAGYRLSWENAGGDDVVTGDYYSATLTSACQMCDRLDDLEDGVVALDDDLVIAEQDIVDLGVTQTQQGGEIDDNGSAIAALEVESVMMATMHEDLYDYMLGTQSPLLTSIDAGLYHPNGYTSWLGLIDQNTYDTKLAVEDIEISNNLQSTTQAHIDAGLYHSNGVTSWLSLIDQSTYDTKLAAQATTTAINALDLDNQGVKDRIDITNTKLELGLIHPNGTTSWLGLIDQNTYDTKLATETTNTKLDTIITELTPDPSAPDVTMLNNFTVYLDSFWSPSVTTYDDNITDYITAAQLNDAGLDTTDIELIGVSAAAFAIAQTCVDYLMDWGDVVVTITCSDTSIFRTIMAWGLYIFAAMTIFEMVVSVRQGVR